MKRNGLPDITQNHLIRLRDIYNYWLRFPKKSDREIINELAIRYGLQKSQAYTDLRLIKALLGDFQKTTKDYHRYRFIEMCQEAYEVARSTKDARSMVAAADKYAKYTQLDKEDIIDRGYDQIVNQPYEPTDDPSVIGIKPIANIREKIEKKIKQYWNDDVEDIQFEEVEYNEEDIFNPKHIVVNE
ncbi:MAG: hypothetical protein RR061_06180 [Muribaculaceae bacterium]